MNVIRESNQEQIRGLTLYKVFHPQFGDVWVVHDDVYGNAFIDHRPTAHLGGRSNAGVLWWTVGGAREMEAVGHRATASKTVPVPGLGPVY